MSIQALVWVIEHSQSRLADRCVLISVANHCDREGKNAWPSVETISHEAKVTTRQVQISTARLSKAGEVRVQKNMGPHGTNLYSLPMMSRDVPLLADNPRSQRGGEKSSGAKALQCEKSSHGANIPVPKPQNSSPEPSIEPSPNPSPQPPFSEIPEDKLAPYELRKVTPLPEGASIPNPDPWGLVKNELKRAVNPQSFDTWILPTRLGYVLERRIVVWVPTADWEYMREQFAGDIQDALKRLGVPYDEFELQPEGGNREARHKESKKPPVTAKVNHGNSR